nr:transposase [Thermoleophilaceae bacterium]
MRRTVLPSAEIERKIDELLASGVAAGDPEGPLSELAQLGAKLIIQRAVEEEFVAFIGRARYERKPDAEPGKRNGWRPRRLQSAEGEIELELPQLRAAAGPFSSKLFPRGSKRLLTTEPLRALVVGAFVRGLSMREVESLCEEAGLGQISKSSASRICRELRERFRAFMARDRCVRLVTLFLDAIYLPVRPSGAKEGVLCAWGFSETGERVLLSVCLGMRESEQDWLALGRDLTARGLGAPLLVVSDGAPGLIGAVEQLWPKADRQRCTVHRLRNLVGEAGGRGGVASALELADQQPHPSPPVALVGRLVERAPVGEPDALTLPLGQLRELVLPASYIEAGNVAHGYAMTVHKSQGMTAERAYVLGSEELYQELGYTALSRHRESCRFYLNAGEPSRQLELEVAGEQRDQVLEQVERALGRSRAQEMALDVNERDEDLRRLSDVELAGRAGRLEELLASYPAAARHAEREAAELA